MTECRSSLRAFSHFLMRDILRAPQTYHIFFHQSVLISNFHLSPLNFFPVESVHVGRRIMHPLYPASRRLSDVILHTHSRGFSIFQPLRKVLYAIGIHKQHILFSREFELRSIDNDGPVTVVCYLDRRHRWSEALRIRVKSGRLSDDNPPLLPDYRSVEHERR
jgi:hypothetical protein